jgi:hypothetical protein
MALVEATAAGRCGHCGRALLLPVLREVDANGPSGRALARCARCGSPNVVQTTVDATAARRAAALRFVTRGASRPWR